jgi:hypothetical protein
MFFWVTRESRDQNCLPCQQTEKAWAWGVNEAKSLQRGTELLIIYFNSLFCYNVIQDPNRFHYWLSKKNTIKGPAPSEPYIPSLHITWSQSTCFLISIMHTDPQIETQQNKAHHHFSKGKRTGSCIFLQLGFLLLFNCPIWHDKCPTTHMHMSLSTPHSEQREHRTPEIAHLCMLKLRSMHSTASSWVLRLLCLWFLWRILLRITPIHDHRPRMDSLLLISLHVRRGYHTFLSHLPNVTIKWDESSKALCTFVNTTPCGIVERKVHICKELFWKL